MVSLSARARAAVCERARAAWRCGRAQRGPPSPTRLGERRGPLGVLRLARRI